MDVRVAYAAWVDLTVDLVTAPCSEFPHRLLLDELSNSFESLSSWHFQEDTGSFSFDLSHPVPGLPGDVDLEIWSRHAQTSHPLLRWFQATLDPRPMTIDRVPRQMAPPEGFAIVHDLCAPLGVDRQLSIPYALTPSSSRAFVMAQTGQDFTDDDIELARLLQPLIAVVGRQCAVLRATTHPHDTLGLTGRERAVLQLLSEGLTARGIASALSISPRTVHSHLSHLYKKLGVSDRLRAVAASRELGLLGDARQPRPEELPTQVVYQSPKRHASPDTSIVGGSDHEGLAPARAGGPALPGSA